MKWRAPEEERARDLPFADDPLLVVDVVEEEVERAHPLDQPALEPVPLPAGDHPRNQVEREDPLDALVLAVDREADPLVHERQLDRVPPLLELLEAEPAELLRESPIVRPRGPGRLEHLVVEGAWVVRLPEGPGRRGRGCGAGTAQDGSLGAHSAVGKPGIEPSQCLDEYRRNGEVPDPVTVSRDHVPWRPLRRRFGESLLVRGRVLGEPAARLLVGGVVLPALGRIGAPLGKPLVLLLAPRRAGST